MTSEPADTPRSPLGWRAFGTRGVKEARAWAHQGGIAVHENLFKSRGRRTAHLLARSEDALVEAAVAVGCSVRWIQRTRTLHFDLVEIYLARALERCAAAGPDHAPPNEPGKAPPSGSDPNPAAARPPHPRSSRSRS